MDKFVPLLGLKETQIPIIQLVSLDIGRYATPDILSKKYLPRQENLQHKIAGVSHKTCSTDSGQAGDLVLTLNPFAFLKQRSELRLRIPLGVMYRWDPVQLHLIKLSELYE